MASIKSVFTKCFIRHSRTNTGQDMGPTPIKQNKKRKQKTIKKKHNQIEKNITSGD